MKNKQLLEKLYVPKVIGEGVAFNLDYMDKNNEELYTIYTEVSDAQRESGLTFGFAYEIGSRAVDILQEVDWNDEDAIREAIDQAVPIYTNELMTIYLGDYSVIDEMEEVWGNSCDCVSRAQRGWYYAIENMLQAIKSKLEAIN